ncbi:MAG: UDP-2,3-diacylglucosamine diphosphatase [Gammaproteobacteria bacterium]|nr:UDP-2,3-diacylglucosamine diphosphatase [Gammaproteobacteria bacterium]MDH4315894.1 UDP-2,3-diacylglucosamine diphosphatase [Gammaproteobacteria bacterium]MDH5500568.1 UDP-2,3-diacylglucosamine diphosphatase [Gammaproteobacteria bacterium]
MTTLFISDLHLESARPDIAAQFIRFLKSEAESADALYILGDLFESWVGDDDPDEHYAVIKKAIRALVDSGTPVFFMHGNRDFMIGAEFAAETGITLLTDPHRANIEGADVLLSHGDALCTDDVEYQKFRLMTRNPQWQAMMLQKSLPERQAFAKQARAASMQHGKSINPVIADVNQSAVESFMTKHGADLLLHGHTHRPAVHELTLDQKPATRIVLGDWYEQGSVVRWDENGPVLAVLKRDRVRGQ